MRGWAGLWMGAGMVFLAACSTSAGGGSATGSVGSSSAWASTRAPMHTSALPSTSGPVSPNGGSPSASAISPSASAGSCAAGHAEVTVSPGDAVVRRLCVRPGTVVSLVLRPRSDDKRWTAVRSSVPVLVVASGWRVDVDGTAHASLRCAGTRGGTADVTASAKAPDVAGAARVVFTLHVSVVPYTTQG